MVSERNPLIRAKRRAGRVKRWIRRKFYERNIGKQYQAWLAEAALVYPATTSYLTTISIIVPVYDPPVAFLRQCLESVVGQRARNWQLVVANDGSTKPDVADFLRQFAAQHEGDDRIVIVEKANGGISSALNAALDRATGEYVGMLDHDDLLDPRCIDEFSRALEEHHFPDAVYSDEDKVNPRGEHFELYCKPTSHRAAAHSDVPVPFHDLPARASGGLRRSAQRHGWRSGLRPGAAVASPARTRHPPAAAYYHLACLGRVDALTIDAKPWAQSAAARVQLDYVDATFGGGTVTPSAVPGLNEVHPRVVGDPVVSVIIPTIGTRNVAGTGRFVDDAVLSLMQRENNATMEIIVVTTGVIPDVPVDLHGKHRIKHVVYDAESFNFSEAINAGRAAATGEYLLLLNDDTTVAAPNPVTRLLEIGQIEGVGVVGCRLTYPDGRLQHVGMVLLPSGPTHCWIGKAGKEPGYFGSTLTPRNYLAVTAAAMLVRTSVFDALGGFDAAFARTSTTSTSACAPTRPGIA
jgi:glycosyltransferase involved in cell wall biosynthesis